MYRRILFAVAVIAGLLTKVVAPTVAAESNDNIAVIIGNKTYQNSRIPSVDYADRDAESIKRFAIDILKIQEDNIIFLQDATQAQIESVFGNERSYKGRLYQYIRPNESNVLIYYSGHGVPGINTQNTYLLPSDGNPVTAEINGYPIDVLYRNLEKLEAKSILVLLEACFSGGSQRGPLITSASPVFAHSNLPSPDRPITVLTAATGQQLASWDDERRHGIFTEYLLRGLYGEADQGRFGNGDGRITVREMKTWLDREMTYRARRKLNRDQTAMIHGIGETVLVALPGGGLVQRPPGDSGTVAVKWAAPAGQVITVHQAQVVATTKAPLRAIPNAKSAVVTQLRPGEQLEATHRTIVSGQTWYRTLFKDREVWVQAAHVTEKVPQAPDSEPPVARNAEPLPSDDRQQAIEEEKRLAALAEERRKAEEAERLRKAQEEQQRLAALAEERRKAEEAERLRKVEEEQKRLAALAEEKRKADEAERLRKAQEEQKRLAALAEERRKAEEAERLRKAQEEQKRLAALAEERRKAEEAERLRKAQEEQKRLAALAEERRIAQEQQRKSEKNSESETPKSSGTLSEPRLTESGNITIHREPTRNDAAPSNQVASLPKEPEPQNRFDGVWRLESKCGNGRPSIWRWIRIKDRAFKYDTTLNYLDGATGRAEVQGTIDSKNNLEISGFTTYEPGKNSPPSWAIHRSRVWLTGRAESQEFTGWGIIGSSTSCVFTLSRQ